MRRITVDEVLKAYEETKLRAITGEYLADIHGEQCGCALGAVKLQIAESLTKDDPFEKLNFSRDMELEQKVQSLLGITSEYEEGFTAGFDGCSWQMCKTHGHFETAGFYLGYVDGKECAAAVQPEDQMDVEMEMEGGLVL